MSKWEWTNMTSCSFQVHCPEIKLKLIRSLFRGRIWGGPKILQGYHTTYLDWELHQSHIFFSSVSGVTFPPGFSGCKPVGCPNPCLPPTCSTVCSTGIQCSNPVTSLPFFSTPVVAPTVPVIPMSYPAPPIYFPAPYPATQPMPVPAPCPVQCMQHTPQFCPAYCSRRCCRAGVPLTRAGKRSGIKRPYHRVVLKTKRYHQKQLKNKKKT